MRKLKQTLTGAELTVLRNKANMTQLKLAYITGVTPKTVNTWENDYCHTELPFMRAIALRALLEGHILGL